MGTADFYRDKRILIFGASGGLGQELARQLALRGAARLYLSGRKASALRTLAEELRAKGTKAEILPCDVTHPEALAACIERAAAADWTARSSPAASRPEKAPTDWRSRRISPGVWR